MADDGQFTDEAQRRELMAVMRSLEPALRAFLRTRLPDGLDPDDVLQDLAVRVISARLPEKIENRSAFLFSAASNLLTDLYRQRGSRKSEHHVPIYDLDLKDPSAGPEELWDSRLRLDRAQRAVLQLPDDQRRIFELYRGEGLTLQQTADETGLTVPRVRKLLATAIATLARRVWSD